MIYHGVKFTSLNCAKKLSVMDFSSLHLNSGGKETSSSQMQCCIPVENVSWMLLSGGAKLEPRSGLGGEGSLF